MKTLVVNAVLVVAVLMAGAEFALAQDAGSSGGACYGNGTCDEGLVCLSQLCVVPPGADCAAIADHLAGILLGNYAPKEDRSAFAADVTADCTTRKLTKDDGECLMRASGRQAIGGEPGGRSPKRLTCRRPRRHIALAQVLASDGWRRQARTDPRAGPVRGSNSAAFPSITARFGRSITSTSWCRAASS